MSLLTNLFKKGISKVGGATKSIKTSASVAGNAMVSGGRKIAVNTAKVTSKGLGEVGNVAGKLVKPSLVVGGIAVGGTKIYDYMKDTGAMTDDLRQYGMTLDLAERESDLVNDMRNNESMSKSGDGIVGSDSLAMGGGLGDYLPMFGNVSDTTDDVAIAQAGAMKAKSYTFGAVALGAMAIGAFIYSGKKRK